MTSFHQGSRAGLSTLAALAAATVSAAELPPTASGAGPESATVALQFVGRGSGEIGPLPYDASYAQLTPAERDVVRSAYQAMPVGDEPPYPAEGVGVLIRPLLKAAHAMYIEGPVDALVEVGPDGVPRSVEVYRSPEPMFTKVVVAVLMGARYKPAMCRGAPCTMQFPLRVKLPPS